MVSPPPNPPQAPELSVDTGDGVDVHASDPFPRHELAELVGQAEQARGRRRQIQIWLFGLGLATLALGLPGERLWGNMELVQLTAGNGERSYGLLFPLAVGIKSILGVTAEQACFLLSALCYGLCLPALVSLLRTIGFDHGLAAISSGTALLGGAAWLGATAPGGFGAGILGATLLLRSLFQTRERLRNGYQWRAALFLTLAFFLSPESLLLFPSVAWAVSRHRGKGRLQGPPAAAMLALAAGVPLVVLMSSGQGSSGSAGASSWGHLLDSLLAGRNPAFAHLPGWILYLSGGLGMGLLGIYSLLFGRRRPEETPAPKWMVPWCLVILTPVVGGSAAAGMVGAYLIPAAAVGLADWLTRRGRDGQALLSGTWLFACQLVLTAVLVTTWSLGDPLRAWRVNAKIQLNPRDVVLVSEPRTGYLLEHRWSMTTFPVEASGERALGAGLPEDVRRDVAGGQRRLVLAAGPRGGAATAVPEDSSAEAPWPRPGQVLSPTLDVWVLGQGRLTLVPAGEPFAAD